LVLNQSYTAFFVNKDVFLFVPGVKFIVNSSCNFFPIDSSNGRMLENLVFMHLFRRGYEIEYLHPRAGGEVDFFARRKRTGEVILIQVCWDISDPKTFKREITGLQNGMRELSVREAVIITWDDESVIDLDGEIAIIPVWKWLLSE
jgi:predicted AAA+ superfamily ATPase